MGYRQHQIQLEFNKVMENYKAASDSLEIVELKNEKLLYMGAARGYQQRVKFPPLLHYKDKSLCRIIYTGIFYFFLVTVKLNSIILLICFTICSKVNITTAKI